MFGGDNAERALALRLLTASRFHPLLMNRLARLATTSSLRPQLMHALETLEKSGNYTQLPGLFATDRGDAKELAYLNDALAISLDQLLSDVGADARRLLWMIALANEPVSPSLLAGVWSGDSHEVETMRRFKKILDTPQGLSPNVQDFLNRLSPEIRARLDALSPDSSAEEQTQQLLTRLLSVGLVTIQQHEVTQEGDVTCHELVRERAMHWMRDHPREQGGLTEEMVRLAYAERLEASYEHLNERDFTAALHLGTRAIAYYVQARAWAHFRNIAGELVTATTDPQHLAILLPYLEDAAESAPPGEARWSSLGHLADALRNTGRPDQSIFFYQQAANNARSSTLEAGDEARRAWSDLTWITANWALAELNLGNLDAARLLQSESLEASRKAGRAAINLIGRELEILRIDIMQGKVDEALPQVEARLAQVESWWRQYRAGTLPEEAGDAERLYRVFVGALDVAREAHRARHDWESAVRLSDLTIQIKEGFGRPAHDIAITRFNRATELTRLKRFDEARADLEGCLRIFEDTPTYRAQVLDSLGVVFRHQGDLHEAAIQTRRALAILNQSPDPVARSVSHLHLGIYLELGGDPQFATEGSRHRLAALIYHLVPGLKDALQRSLVGYALGFRQAEESGVPLQVPRVHDLVMDPMFHPLSEWLRQRNIDVAELQAAVDQRLALARVVAAEMKEPSAPADPS
jgi:tetratricopeptide (TPR) repeat protein